MTDTRDPIERPELIEQVGILHDRIYAEGGGIGGPTNEPFYYRRLWQSTGEEDSVQGDIFWDTLSATSELYRLAEQEGIKMITDVKQAGISIVLNYVAWKTGLINRSRAAEFVFALNLPYDEDEGQDDNGRLDLCAHWLIEDPSKVDARDYEFIIHAYEALMMSDDPNSDPDLNAGERERLMEIYTKLDALPRSPRKQL
jgi:hypothetical protein